MLFNKSSMLAAVGALVSKTSGEHDLCCECTMYHICSLLIAPSFHGHVSYLREQRGRSLCGGCRPRDGRPRHYAARRAAWLPEPQHCPRRCGGWSFQALKSESYVEYLSLRCRADAHVYRLAASCQLLSYTSPNCPDAGAITVASLAPGVPSNCLDIAGPNDVPAESVRVVCGIPA